MSNYYGINSNSVSSFFNNSFVTKSKSNLNHTSFQDLYGSLGDYGTLRSGTYLKLLNSYYTKTSDSSNHNSTSNVTDNKMTATSASTLKSDADSLSASKFTKENQVKLTEQITKFVDSYNDLATKHRS